MIPFILGALAAVGLSELSKRNKPKMADGGSVDSEFVKDKSRLLEILEMKGMSTLEHEPEITAIKNKYKGYRQDYDIKDPRTKAGMDMLGFLRDKNLYAKGGGVDGIQISVNAQRYLEMLEEMYPKFLNIDTTTPSKDINKAISELEEKGLIKRLSYSRGFAEYGLKDKKYATGGGVGYKKDWEVVGITMQGKKFKKTITLGRMSDREDVKNAIKRMQSDDFRVMEVTSIKELQTYATGGALSDAVKMTKEQLKETKDLFEKYSSKEKRKDLLKFKKSALKEYGKDIGGLYVKDVKRKAKFLADHPEIIVGKVF